MVYEKKALSETLTLRALVVDYEIKSRDDAPAHLGVVLWSYAGRRRHMSVPNLKRIALFVQKLLGGPKFRPPQTPSTGDAHYLHHTDPVW